MKQSPAPGSSQLLHRGDAVTFRLDLSESRAGTAWLRTTIGNAQIRRKEIVAHFERDEPLRARDWRDLPMTPENNGESFSITIPLTETGRFEAKVYFLEEGSEEPIWPNNEGNTVIHVAAPWTVSGNGIYAAFPRLFGDSPDPQIEAASVQLEELGGKVIRPSGTLRDVEKKLDHIIDDLGFGILLLLPVFPVPTSRARMGQFGSPFAGVDFFSIDPALTEFDRIHTPLAQFLDLLDGVHQRGARLFMDVPINHTGWASQLQSRHPEWFVRKDDGTFESPGVWDVQWMDLFQLDYSKRELWLHIAEVFLFWCRQGVDGFRCDAGHLLPIDVWVYIIAKVRCEFPDTLFLLEGLGSTPAVSAEMRDMANFDWDYSETFQQDDRRQLEEHVPRNADISKSVCLLIDFAETHDNPRMAAKGEPFAKMRTALAALCSTTGGWGITCGVEWFADEKINVHRWTSMRWGSERNQVAEIARINALLRTHPAFQKNADQRLVTVGDGNGIALLRRDSEGGNALLVLINLDPERSCKIEWSTESAPEFCGNGGAFRDLLTGEEMTWESSETGGQKTLEPAAVHAVTTAHETPSLEQAGEGIPASRQRLKALATEIGLGTEDEDLEKFQADPIACLEADTEGDYPQISRWSWPRDVKRVALLPPGHDLVVTAPHPFRLKMESPSGDIIAAEQSHALRSGDHFTILNRKTIEPGTLKIHLTVFPPGWKAERSCSEIRALSKFHRKAPVSLSLDRTQVAADHSHSLCTNGRGAMAQVRARFGEVRSQYDCLLGANLDPHVPVDRKVMFTRCRAWITWRGRSHAVNIDTLKKFTARPAGGATWDFVVPLGGQYEIKLRVRFEMRPDANAVDLRFIRLADDGGPKSVKLILRPDVEDRDNHHKTGVWDAKAKTVKRGFRFPAGSSHPVEIYTSRGEFVEQPEWQEDIHHPAEGERGLDDRSNLFSPGYFEAALTSSKSLTLKARVAGGKGAPKRKSRGPKKATLGELARLRLDDFIVARDDSLTVIAGYPWFLDWGRDTLIFLRGVIAAGRFDEAIRILETFARFEDRGTLPNMIRGGDASDRDTSDAPLWFIVACADLADAHPRIAHRFLESECNGRTVIEIIQSIVTHYKDGTPNGIRMDPESGLIYSPPHFTWMDTNYPPGTPRAGYPIEIQAMWVAALNFMHDLEPEGPWNSLAEKARESILRFFASDERQFLSDCLHAAPGESAAQAVPDDHLRSNQLFAITLKAVTDAEIGKKVVRACEELLVPGAIRSLADRPVKFGLPYNKDGHTLNDPHWPYWGRYSGPEDYTRKPAYHNGTAWTWTFPSYSEALYLVHRSTANEAALAILGTSEELFKTGSIGQIPEILDGDAPHAQKGCGAQAWGVSELYRVLKLLGGC